MEEREMRLGFLLRMIHNRIKTVISKSAPKTGPVPGSQLQGGIVGYLYHHREQSVYQRDIEKEFRISRATATNTLQVMEKNGLIVRKSQDKDARLKRIFMTEEAVVHHARVEAQMKMIDAQMLQGLTEEEVSELNRCLRIVMKNLELLNEEYSNSEENGKEV